MARRAAERTVPRSEPESYLFMEWSGPPGSMADALMSLPVTPGTITSPKRATGIIFHESSLTAVISALKETRDFERVPTENPNVTYLKFPEVFRVETEMWNGERPQQFRDIVKKILLPAVKKHVVLDTPHGSEQRPIEDGKFYVHIWSSPVPKYREARVPVQIWGLEVGCRDPYFQPSGKGEPIIDPAGYCAAELVGNNLYIHHDICHYGSQPELQIFEKILEKAVILLTVPESERMKQRREMSRAEYLKMCTRRFSVVLKETEKKIDRSAKEMEDLQAKIVKTIREAEGLKKKLEQLRKSTPDLEAYGKEFDKLFQMPQVIDIKVSENIISVFYDDIHLEHEGTTYLLGKYRMDIFYDGSNGCLRFENLTKRKGSYDHPHIKEGKPCLGTIAESIATLIAEHQYSVIAILGVQFLKSYYPNGQHVEIQHWRE